MSQNKHTPGPWIVSTGNVPGSKKEALAVLTANHKPGQKKEAICIVANLDNLKPYDEANARLIAAAPAMYDLLKDLETLLIGVDMTDYPVDFELTKIKGLLATLDQQK